MTTQSKAPVEDRIAEIRERHKRDWEWFETPQADFPPRRLIPAQANSDRGDLLTELTASQSRERALGKQVFDLTGIVSDKNDKIAGLTSENKALKEALKNARPLVEKWCHTQGNSQPLYATYLEPIDAALQQSQGGGE